MNGASITWLSGGEPLATVKDMNFNMKHFTEFVACFSAESGDVRES